MEMIDMQRKLPPIGARIMKSAMSVALCMVVYWFRTLLPVGNGIPFYSALAALWCMQPYTNTTKNNALQRSFGTLTGAAFGLPFLMLLNGFGLREPFPIYLLSSAFIIPVIYVTVITDNRNASFFSCVVFLSIAMSHSFDENPYLFVLNRVLDTFIGIAVGVAVNGFHFPVRHDNETLYVCGIDDVLISEHAQYSKVELNRMIRSGVKFTVMTTRTAAEVMSLMKGTELNLPIIVMDGAILYDVQKKEYLDTFYLQPNIAAKAERIISECGLHCFVNVMLDTTLLIYYGTFRNPAEKELFASHKISPYRNYVHARYRRHDYTEQTVYITVLAEKNDILSLESMLRAELRGCARISVSRSEYAGYLYLKIYSPLATKQNMLKKLKAYSGISRTVTFGSIEGQYDVYISDGGGNATIKKLKKLYRTHEIADNIGKTH